jgi:hypothetical protein
MWRPSAVLLAGGALLGMSGSGMAHHSFALNRETAQPIRDSDRERRSVGCDGAPLNGPAGAPPVEAPLAECGNISPIRYPE